MSVVRFSIHMRHVDRARSWIVERVSASHPPQPTMADQQKLCHEFSHDIEREQTVFAAAEQAEDRLVYSGLDEILQPLGAMLRGSRDGEGLDRFVGDQRCRAGYLFFGVSRDAGEAVDAVRQKLAFVMRNKFLAANIKASGIAVDQEAVIAAIARRDIAGAAALVPDEAVEAFGIAGTPQHCTKRLQDFIEAGINEPVLGLLGNSENCLLALDVMREFVA